MFILTSSRMFSAGEGFAERMHSITRLARKSGVHLASDATLEVIVDGTLIDGAYTLRHVFGVTPGEHRRG